MQLIQIYVHDIKNILFYLLLLLLLLLLLYNRLYISYNDMHVIDGKKKLVRSCMNDRNNMIIKIITTNLSVNKVQCFLIKLREFYKI